MVYTRGTPVFATAPTSMTLVDGQDYPLSLAGYDNGSPFIVKDYDFGSPSPREVVGDRAGRPGVDDLTSLFGSRTITLQLDIMDAQEATRHQLLELLRSMINPSHRPWLYAKCQGWEQERRISLRGNPLSCVVGQNHSSYLEVSLVFSAPSGVWQGVEDPLSKQIYPLAGASAFTIAAGAALSAAFTITAGGSHSTGPDPTIPAFSLIAGSGNNITTVSDLGSSTTYPTFIINGLSDSPVIRNLTTNTTMSLANFTVPNGHFAVLDMDNKTALLDGDPGQSIYSKIDWSISSWLSLDNNDVVQFTTKSNDSASSLVISYIPNFF